jgi:hypothetical protein
MYAETCAEMLRAWDAGEIVWTVEMGGMGPGYEQAIQVLMIELVRDHINAPLPEVGSDEARRWGDETVSRLDETCGGFSGAQVDAAKQLAYRFLRDGPAAAIQSVDSDRRTMISKHWPHAPEPVAASST